MQRPREGSGRKQMAIRGSRVMDKVPHGIAELMLAQPDE
jgi:hypothetical protein